MSVSQPIKNDKNEILNPTGDPVHTTTTTTDVTDVTDVTNPDATSKAKRKAKRTREGPTEVIMFTDASEPGEPIAYIKEFSELLPKEQRRLRNKYISFHDIEEEEHEEWEERIQKLIKSSMTVEKWMMVHSPDLRIVCHFTWGQC